MWLDEPDHCLFVACRKPAILLVYDTEMLLTGSQLDDYKYRMVDCRLICDDALDVLRDMPAESVDLTVTSPPYNIGKQYEQPLPIGEYLEWCARWMAELYRVTKPAGAFWLNLGYVEVPSKGRAVPLPYLLWDRSPFYLHQEIVWHYGAGVAARRAFSPRNEKWLWYLKDPEQYTFNLDAVRDPNVKYPSQKKNGKLKCNPLGKNPGDVWIVPKVTSGAGRASKERTPHPAQFPIAVITRIIRATSREGDLVLDPFVGSGSTLVAAILTKRRCVGIEIRPDYCAIAERRIRSAQARREELALFG
jgi:adenine-specific DNA-methyltransferase